MSQIPFNRRRFLQGMGASAALLSSGWAPHALGSPSRKVGVALLGLGGYSSQQLAPALQLTQHCELRGVVTGSPEKVPQWQERYGIKDANVYSYENLHTIADNPDIDVVYVVTPPSLHKKYSIMAAEAGKHVWCEKPMAMDEAECQAIIDACRKNRVKLSIGYRLHHEPNTQTLMRFAQEKPFGAIETVASAAAYAGGERRSGDDWRMQRKMGGGAMYDMGVYALNGSRYAVGTEPLAVSARYEITHPEVFTHTDSTTHFTLEFADEVVSECMTSFVKPGNYLRVNCAQGSYHLEPMSTYHGVQGSTSDGRKLDKPIANQQARQMDNDALAILRDEPVMVPGEEGLRDIRIVQAIFESAENDGKRITL